MPCVGNAMRATSILLASFLVVPAALAANGDANSATVTIAGTGHAVSICQLAIHAMPVILLQLEDGLGLATLAARESFRLDATSTSGGGSSCLIDVGLLDIVGLPTTRVTGPTLVGEAEASLTTGPRMPQAEGSSIAVCQRIILAGALLVGGGAYGLQADEDGVVDVEHRVVRGEDASCDVRIGEIRTQQDA